MRYALIRPAFSISLLAVLLAFGLLFGFLNHVTTEALVLEEGPLRDAGPYMGVHAAMSAQDPLSQKGYWAFAAAAAAATGSGASPVGAPSAGGIRR